MFCFDESLGEGKLVMDMPWYFWARSSSSVIVGFTLKLLQDLVSTVINLDALGGPFPSGRWSILNEYVQSIELLIELHVDIVTLHPRLGVPPTSGQSEV